MQKSVPEFDIQHVASMVDMYAAQNNMRWDGEPLQEGDEIWIGIPGKKRVQVDA
jgi:hypothetical protein